MKKLIVLLMLFAIPLFAQQLNYTWGCIQGGTAYDGAGLAFIDTTNGTTNDIYIDLNDWYPGFDINPLVSNDVLTITGSSENDSAGVDSIYGSTTSTTIISSNLFYIGTFYVAFDNQGVGAPTTDSLKYTIKAYPGVHTAASRMFAGVDWGTAVTLETIATVNDYFSVNNVYVHATKYKHYPPECIKLEIAPTGGAKTANCDDSTFVNWRFAYPAIYQVHKERK
jgi:hypothetical protein